MKEMKNKAAPAAVSVPKCPFPCGWENLHKLAVAEGAFLANSLCEDEPLTEHQRDTVMRVVNYSIEMARAALAATPAADAPLHAEMLSALQAVAMDAVGVGGGENTIGNAARAKVDAVLVKLGVPWADRGAAAAAPVVLPEPLAFYDGNKWYADEAAAICACADLPKLQKVYTEQQVRALLAQAATAAAPAPADALATAAGLPAQAVKLLAADHSGMKVGYRGLFSQVQRAIKRTDPGCAKMIRQLEGHLQELGQRWYAGDTNVVDEILQLYCIERDARKTVLQDAAAAPKAQAEARDVVIFEQRMSDWQHGDALDAERYRWLRSRDLETISQGGVFAGMTPENIILNEEDLDQAVDSAIAAAKGEGQA